MNHPMALVLWARQAAPRKNHRGVTLMELLTVVAIISILSALLAPFVLHALRTGGSAECKSNLHQLHLGMMAYAKEFSMYIVPARNDFSLSGMNDPIYWYHTLDRFVKEHRIWACPVKKSAAVGYGQNYRVLGGINSRFSLWHRYQPLSRVKNPSGSVIFCDTGYVTNRNDPASKWKEDRRSCAMGRCRARIEGYTEWDTDPWRPVPRHSGYQANCLFFDGHIEGIATADLCRDRYGDPGCLMDNE